jgi:hypothetical protein
LRARSATRSSWHRDALKNLGQAPRALFCLCAALLGHLDAFVRRRHRLLRRFLQRLDDRRDVRRRLRRSVGEVANLFGNDGKAAPASPARAASIDAFSDSRFVRSAIKSIVSTMLPISLARLPISRMTPADCDIDSRTRPNPWIER